MPIVLDNPEHQEIRSLQVPLSAFDMHPVSFADSLYIVQAV